MQRKWIEPMSVVHQIACDRCGREAERNETEFHEMTSISFRASYGSIFGDGNQVEVDLCQHCLQDILGAWLRVEEPANTDLATRPQFGLERHGGNSLCRFRSRRSPDDFGSGLRLWRIG